MTTGRTLATWLSFVCAAITLVACAGPRTTPGALTESETAPRLSERVPVVTPCTYPVPTSELVPASGRTRLGGEVERPRTGSICCCKNATREEYERNDFSLFLGYTSERGGGGATAGLGYERRLSRLIGIGAFGEYVFGDEHVPVVGAAVFLHATEELRMTIAAGAEHDEDTKPLGRVGFAYTAWKTRRLEFSPAVYMDIVRGEDPIFILGLEIGKGW